MKYTPTAVSKNDSEASKVAFVLSATSFEKWTTLSGLAEQLKGLQTIEKLGIVCETLINRQLVPCLTTVFDSFFVEFCQLQLYCCNHYNFQSLGGSYSTVQSCKEMTYEMHENILLVLSFPGVNFSKF